MKKSEIDKEVLLEILKALKQFRILKYVIFLSMVTILGIFKLIGTFISSYYGADIAYIPELISILFIIFFSANIFFEKKSLRRFRVHLKEIEYIIQNESNDLDWFFFRVYPSAVIGFSLSLVLYLFSEKEWVSLAISVFYIFLASTHRILSPRGNIKVLNSIKGKN